MIKKIIRKKNISILINKTVKVNTPDKFYENKKKLNIFLV